MFSQTQEYALRAVVWLAQHHEEGPIGNLRVAEETKVPPAYLSKVMQGLTKAKLLTSKRGVGGGFQLAKPPESLTVLEVVNAVDPIQRISSCPLGLKSHQKHLCPVHARVDGAMALAEEALGNSTIAEVMSEPGRPLPLVESPRQK